MLVNILDPNDKLHTDSTRMVSLRILNTAFETAGTHIGHFPSLTSLVLDHGCKYLFQLARSDHPAVLHLALRTISAMFKTMPFRLKLQQELFLTFTIDRLAPIIPPGYKPPIAGDGRNASPRPGTPQPAAADLSADGNPGSARPSVAPARGETRELMLETLSQIARHPSFMVDLYTNYDCDINCENLFSKLVDFLVKVGILDLYLPDTLTLAAGRISITLSQPSGGSTAELAVHLP